MNRSARIRDPRFINPPIYGLTEEKRREMNPDYDESMDKWYKDILKSKGDQATDLINNRPKFSVFPKMNALDLEVSDGGKKRSGKKRSCKKRGGKKRTCKKRGGKKRSCKKRN